MIYKIGKSYQRIYQSPTPLIKESVHTKDLKPIVEKFFAKHKGDVNNFLFATTHEDVNKLLDFLLEKN